LKNFVWQCGFQGHREHVYTPVSCSQPDFLGENMYVPKEMRSIPNWVLFKNELRGEKITKVPYQINGKKAASDDPATWSHYELAQDYNTPQYDGIGFNAGREPSGFILIDIDRCVGDNEGISAFAREIIDTANSCTEYSPSEKGFHIYCFGELGKPGMNVQNWGEIYDNKRFFTYTGNTFEERKIIRKLSRDEVDKIYNLIASKKKIPLPAKAVAHESDGICVFDKETLLKKMFASRKGAKIKALYDGDKSMYGDNASCCDMALCNYLAFWTNKDAKMMDEIIRGSKLMRDKWDSKRGNTTYGAITIKKAIDICGTTYTGSQVTKTEHTFYPIGYTEKTIIVYSTITKSYIECVPKPSEIKQYLYRIVPDWGFWSGMACKDNGAPDKEKCAEDIIRHCLMKRNLSSKISKRGTGIYYDNGHIVSNFGDRIFVDGVEALYNEVKSDYFYISSNGIKIVENYDYDNAEKLCNLIENTSLATELDRIFYLGGIVSGFLSGLPIWKTHIWVNAEAGSGKTKLAEAVLLPACNACGGHMVSGNVSEAGIRQSIQYSSTIYVHDEAESSAFLDKEIELIRASSSGGKIVKGTQDQRGIEYTVSSLFYLLSISSSIEKLADSDRFVYVNMLQSEGSQKEWKKISRELRDIAESGFYYSLFYRCTKIATTYMESIEKFKKCFMATIDEKMECKPERKARMADKLASLICGRWHIMMDTVISDRYCDDVIDMLIKSEEMDNLRNERENNTSTPLIMLNHFLDHIFSDRGNHVSVRVLLSGDKGRANFVLNSYGIYVDNEGNIYLRCKNKNITKIFKESGYQDYKKILRMIPSVEIKTNHIAYESEGTNHYIKQHSIKIPKDIFEQNEWWDG